MARVRDVFTRSAPKPAAIKGLAKAAPRQTQPKAQAANAGRYAGLANRAANPPPTTLAGMGNQPARPGVSAEQAGQAMRSGLARNLNAFSQAANVVGDAARGLFSRGIEEGRSGAGVVRPNTLNPAPNSMPFNQVTPAQARSAADRMVGRTGARPTSMLGDEAAGRNRTLASAYASNKIKPNTYAQNVLNNPNYRDENAGILMTADEYQRRNNARLSVSNPNSPLFDPTSPFFQASMAEYFKNAITASNQGANMQEWEKANPRPYAYWEPTAEEERARNASLVNAGLDNYKWVPYGSGFLEESELAPLADNAGSGGGGGDGGYYPGYDYGGGGGGSGYDYTPELARWYNQMAMWSFSPQDYNKG